MINTHGGSRQTIIPSNDNQQASKTAAIIDIGLSGHRQRYIQWVATALIRTGYSPTILLLCDDEIPKELLSWAQNLGIPVSQDRRSAKLSPRILLRSLSFYFLTFRVLKESRLDYDLLFFPYFDYISYVVAALGMPKITGSVSGILMRPYFHVLNPDSLIGKTTNWLKRILFEKLLRLRKISTIYTIDELLYERYGSQEHRSLQYLPDPAFLAENVPIGSPLKETFSILVYGSLQRRKGLNELLAGIEYLGSRYQGELVFAGKIDPEMLTCIEQLMIDGKWRIETFDRYITAEEELAFFSNADLVWVGYVKFYNMSGVLAQAGIARKPVISSDEGLVGHLVRKYGLGLAVDISSPEAVGNAILELNGDSRKRSTMGENGYKKFSPHTVARFVDIVSECELET